jgi:hypothetical protein
MSDATALEFPTYYIRRPYKRLYREEYGPIKEFRFIEALIKSNLLLKVLSYIPDILNARLRSLMVLRVASKEVYNLYPYAVMVPGYISFMDKRINNGIEKEHKDLEIESSQYYFPNDPSYWSDIYVF